MLWKAIDGLFTVVHRGLCYLIVPPVATDDKIPEKIDRWWKDEKGKWHKVIYVRQKDSPRP